MGSFQHLLRTPLRGPEDGEERAEPTPPRPEDVYRPVEEDAESRRRRSLSGWVERRASTVVSKLYHTKADDIEERARRAVKTAYQEHADDLEERAVRALRRALTDEADRIKEVIEHSVQVKKREVRLSLLVLLVAALIYFLLDWFASGGGP